MLAPNGESPRWGRSKPMPSWRAMLLVTALLLAGEMAAIFYQGTKAVETSASEESSTVVMVTPTPRPLPENIYMGLPKGLATVSVSFSAEELWEGKLLFIDSNHPVPSEAPAPNTLSIAAAANGQVAVRTVQTAVHPEMIEALEKMFLQARIDGVSNWVVWEGARSNAQQLELQIERLRIHAMKHPLEEAAGLAAQQVPAPGCSEHQTAYVVDIRLADGWNSTPDTRLLSASKEGRYLIGNAWRYGFIHRYSKTIAPPYEDEAYHFRYVGNAHSTLMHMLDMDLEEYLALLHRAGNVSCYEAGELRYIVVCKKMEQQMIMKIPKGGTLEASMDNLGYAVCVVSFPSAQETAP